ncbi:MAG: glycosyltransferase family 4 protein [Ferruginibacter sp.]|nr:glycosyltransferase family 4 protein [Ferruginibacter sp.]
MQQVPPKNILFISYDGMTDPLGQSQVIPYLAGLTKYGYRFTILSCDKPAKYASGKDYVEKLLLPYPIKWHSIPYHKSPPVLSAVYDMMQLKKLIRTLQKEEVFDMVHTRPGVPTLLALWMKKKYGTKFFNDIRGFWADERVDGGMWNLKNPLFKKIYSFFKNHENECIRLADHNNCLTFAAKKEIQSWPQIPNQPVPIDVIPCSADLNLFDPAKIDPAQKEIFRRKLGIEKTDLIISYLGSIGGWYLTDDMLRFCKQIADRIPAAKFLFISPHRHEQILAAAAKYHLPEQRILTTHAARHEVPVLLSFSDYSIFFIKPCYSKISSSPTKHGEIMAMGIPVITNSGVGDVKEIVEKYNAGFVLDDFSDESYLQVIEKLKNDVHLDALKIRAGAREFYSLSNAVELYKKGYDKVLRS